jgi:hypothetical protein
MLEKPGLPSEVSVAPGTEATDGTVPVDAHAPHVVGDSASKRFDANDVITPPVKCLPRHCHILAKFRTSLRCGREGLVLAFQAFVGKEINPDGQPFAMRLSTGE